MTWQVKSRNTMKGQLASKSILDCVLYFKVSFVVTKHPTKFFYIEGYSFVPIKITPYRPP